MAAKYKATNFYSDQYSRIENPSTHETYRIEGAAIELIDDFLCGVVNTNKWTEVDVGDSTKAIAAGILTYHLHATTETEEAGIYAKDSKDFNLDKGVVFEARLAVHVAPTLGGEIMIGLQDDSYGAGSNRILVADEVTRYAAFGFYTTVGSGLIPVIRTDDSSANSGIVSSALSALTLDDYHIFRIEITNVASARFYVDGVRVASSTTFDMSAGSNVMVQPIILAQKNGANAGLGDIYVDYIKAWQLAR
jgi:hypothetical protein